MKKLSFYIADVFAEEKYAGNQLAVVRNAKALPASRMQRIAKEMNFSETTFILSDEERKEGYDVRIFTPKKEIPFAGHPTLGTAYIIQQEILQNPVDKVVLNLKVGQIPVTFSYVGGQTNILWMKQIHPTYGQILEAEQIFRVLNLSTNDLDEQFPIQEVSTGIFCLIIPLKTLDAVKRVRIDREKYFRLIEKTQAKSILVFCPETYSKENNLNVRMFADYYGVPEDPATGSANGCLAAYLVKHRYFGKDSVDIRVEQGFEIGRPSLLLLKAEENEEKKINVSVGGKVVMVVKGELV